MPLRAPIATMFAAALCAASLAHAQTPGKIDLQAAEAVAELVRAPVFAADGTQVGDVADVSLDEEGRPTRLRITTGARLGFGMRTVEINPGLFTTLRGAVMVDLPAQAVEALPDLAERGQE